MNSKQLKKLISEEVSKAISEQAPNMKHEFERPARDFIINVLKFGSKRNVFDVYMKKNNMNESDLTAFVSYVANKIIDDWT